MPAQRLRVRLRSVLVGMCAHWIEPRFWKQPFVDIHGLVLVVPISLDGCSYRSPVCVWVPLKTIHQFTVPCAFIRSQSGCCRLLRGSCQRVRGRAAISAHEGCVQLGSCHLYSWSIAGPCHETWQLDGQGTLLQFCSWMWLVTCTRDTFSACFCILQLDVVGYF